MKYVCPKIFGNSADWSIDYVKDLFRLFISFASQCRTKQQLLTDAPFCRIIKESEFRSQELVVYLSYHFLDTIEKEKFNNSSLLWKALLNLRYGYDLKKAKSHGGKDGIFHVDESFRPKNEMIRKLYDRYLYTEKGKGESKHYFGDISKIQGVRVVAHGIRLLGFIKRCGVGENKFIFVLIDVDISI